MSRIVGDRCVILLLTETPWRWRRYFRAWRRIGVEWVVCSEVSGSGGLLTIARDDTGFNDLLAIVTDLDGVEIVAKYNDPDPELPECPIVEVMPGVIKGGFEQHMARYKAVDGTWKKLSWPARHRLVRPSPVELAAWCVGWWAGRRDKALQGETP